MAFVKGFNFRGSSGYVTDGADEVYVLSTDTYPTTRGGVTFGWESGSPIQVNRDSGLDPRLAGINACFSTAPETFRIDLPNTGTYDIRLAIGDASSGQPSQNWRVKDGTTQLLTVTGTITSGSFRDATATEYTGANWPANNTASQQAFATTIFRIETAAFAGSNVIAHVGLSEVTGGGGTRLLNLRRRMAA